MGRMSSVVAEPHDISLLVQTSIVFQLPSSAEILTRQVLLCLRLWSHYRHFGWKDYFPAIWGKAEPGLLQLPRHPDRSQVFRVEFDRPGWLPLDYHSVVASEG
jgi:hypothetical protein